MLLLKKWMEPLKYTVMLLPMKRSRGEKISTGERSGNAAASGAAGKPLLSKGGESSLWLPGNRKWHLNGGCPNTAHPKSCTASLGFLDRERGVDSWEGLQAAVAALPFPCPGPGPQNAALRHPPLTVGSGPEQDIPSHAESVLKASEYFETRLPVF